MKTLILSDVHSNIYALEAIWAQEKDSDLVICVGDLVDFGPNPQEVIDWVRDHEAVCVQGNHDRYVIYCYRNDLTAVTVPAPIRRWAHLNAGQINEEAAAFLENLPEAVTLTLDGLTYGVTHLYDEYREIITLHQFDQFRRERFDGDPAAVTRLIFGHTHRQSIRYLSHDKLWLNPGSASYRRPDDPDQTTHYATIVNGRLSLHRLPYDILPLRRYIAQVTLKESDKNRAVQFFAERDTP